MAINLKCNLPEDRQAEVFGYFTGVHGFYLTEADEMQMQQLMDQYLFYDAADRRVRQCFCTSCGRFVMFRGDDPTGFFLQKHNNEIECPNCGAVVQLKAIGRMGSFASINDADERRFSIFRPAPDGGLLVISGFGRRHFSHNNLMPEITFQEKERQYFAPGVRMRWRRHWEYAGIGRTGYAYPAGWDVCTHMDEPFHPSMNTSDGSYYPISAEAIGATDLQYCRIEDWYQDRCKVDIVQPTEGVRFLCRFLSYYTAYPTMEMAVRLGWFAAIDDLVDKGKKNAQILDWGAKTTWDFLRLSKADGKAFLKAGADLDDLHLYRASRKWDKSLTLTRFWELLDQCGNDSRVTELVLKSVSLTKLSPQKVIHYLSDAGRVPKQKAQLLADYLEFAKILKYDLRRQDVALPKDLNERHDAAASAVAIIQTAQRKAESAQKYGGRVRAVQQMYEFSLGGLEILAPLDPQDIVDEGKKQMHCVGGYAARHFQGVLEILFLRKVSAPNKPWITIEMAHRSQPTGKVHIKQMYDACNRHGLLHWKKEIGWFIDAWTDWLRAGSPRNNAGLPIIREYEEVSA